MLLITRLFLLFLLILTAGPGRAGVVRGHLTNQQGAPLSFANVAVRDAAFSTAANEEGYYQLRLPAGTYALVVQYVGYHPRSETVRVAGGDSATVLDLKLEAENYQLGEVLVRSSDRDPAYALVQHAINWRPYHQREVAAYQARTYLKSLFGLNEMPTTMMGFKLPTEELGPNPKVLYLEETVSELSFRQPGPEQERMVSTRVSGRSKSFGSSRAGNQFHFYTNLQRVSTVTQPLVSPIADGALTYYTYELVGTSRQDGLTLHKIRVAPRHAQSPAYSGFIYLLDGTWRLHSVALTVDKHLLKDGYEGLRVEQQFMPAPGSPTVWVLQSQKLHFNFSMMGFKGEGNTQTVFLNYHDVVPAYAARPEERVIPTTATAGRETVALVRQQRPRLRGLGQSLPAAAPAAGRRPGEILRVEAGANERSAAYWDNIRPVPLTSAEQHDYHLRDSLEARQSSRRYLDSMDRLHNKLRLGKLLVSGYDHRNSFRQRRFNLAPLYEGLQYNAVEGTVLQATGTYQQRYPDGRTFTLAPTLRYGAAAQLLSPLLTGAYLARPQQRTEWSFELGRTVADFNDRTQLRPLHNSLYTLLRNENFAKLFQQHALALGFGTDLVPGLRVQTTLRYADRQPLTNHTAGQLFDNSERAFTANEPESAELGATPISRSQALTFAADLAWRPGQRYLTRPDRLVLLGSRYPTFRLGWQQGLGGVLGSDVRYTLLQAGISHTQPLGLLGEAQVSATVGGFVGSPRLEFMDYRHFAGNRTILASDFGQFQLLDYYRFSTRQHFAEGHYQQFFHGLLLNKLPGLRQLKLQEVGSFHYLFTPALGHYAELGGGLQRDFLLGHIRADVVTTLLPGQPRATGMRLRVWRNF